MVHERCPRFDRAGYQCACTWQSLRKDPLQRPGIKSQTGSNGGGGRRRRESAQDLEHIFRIPPVDEFFSPIPACVPMQLMSYYVADFLGKDVDQPRNLAKSVTVE
ncbi:MAG: hypothetical protein R3C24_01535 [Cyanobacteriota/Melainabacteria group bacterium]